jgi:hypothetical protein
MVTPAGRSGVAVNVTTCPGVGDAGAQVKLVGMSFIAAGVEAGASARATANSATAATKEMRRTDEWAKSLSTEHCFRAQIDAAGCGGGGSRAWDCRRSRGGSSQAAAGAESAVYQAVCSPFRNPLDRHERTKSRRL